MRRLELEATAGLVCVPSGFVVERPYWSVICCDIAFMFFIAAVIWACIAAGGTGALCAIFPISEFGSNAPGCINAAAISAIFAIGITGSLPPGGFMKSGNRLSALFAVQS